MYILKKENKYKIKFSEGEMLRKPYKNPTEKNVLGLQIIVTLRNAVSEANCKIYVTSDTKATFI